MKLLLLFCFLSLCLLGADGKAVGQVNPPNLQATVDEAIRPVKHKYNIPGMAVVVTVSGKNYFFNYGVASRKTQRRVTTQTLFEIGSLSKIMAATVASYAQVNGRLSFADPVSKYLPSLRGSRFDHIQLLHLGTHTSGLPLFVPDNVTNTDQLLNFLKRWQPTHPVGTHRIYSNIGVGLLGMIAAKSLHETYEGVVEHKISPELGMRHSYITVPPGRRGDYAQGYTKEDKPIRLQNAVLASEAYGVKTCTADLARFMEANMKMSSQTGKLLRAVRNTHIGYFKSGAITQDLVWEQYPYPVSLKRVLAGNAATYQDAVATPFSLPLPPQKAVLMNKTGSTNGFAAYIAYIPAKKLGVVILANKNYPIEPRVTAAYQILTRLDHPALVPR